MSALLQSADVDATDQLPEKTYVGRRMPAPRGFRGRCQVVVRCGGRDEPLAHHVHHSPDGFEWGYGGSGAAELARCILWDHLGVEPPPSLYQHFKYSVVARLDHDGWEITSRQLRAWLGMHLPGEAP